MRGIHRSPVDSPHKGQWRGALTFSLICAWTNGSVNNRDAAQLRRHRAHYDVTLWLSWVLPSKFLVRLIITPGMRNIISNTDSKNNIEFNKSCLVFRFAQWEHRDIVLLFITRHGKCLIHFCMIKAIRDMFCHTLRNLYLVYFYNLLAIMKWMIEYIAQWLTNVAMLLLPCFRK